MKNPQLLDGMFEQVAGNRDVPEQEEANGSPDDERTGEQPISIEDEYYDYQDYDEEVPHECWVLWVGSLPPLVTKQVGKLGLFSSVADSRVL